MAIGAGLLMRVFDEGEFKSAGDGVWWAIVVSGVTLVAFLTATVTSAFVSSDQADLNAEADKKRAAE